MDVSHQATSPLVNDPDQIAQDLAAAAAAAVIRNINGLTPEEQAAYEAYYTRLPQYDPDQVVPKEH